MNGKRGALQPPHTPLPIVAEQPRQSIPDRLPTHSLIVDGRRPSRYPHYETLGDALSIITDDSGSTYHIHIAVGHTNGGGQIVGPNITITSDVDSDIDGIVTNYGEFEGIGDVHLAGNNYGSIRAGGNVTVCGVNEGFIQLGSGNVTVGGNNTGAIITTGTVMIGKNDPGTRSMGTSLSRAMTAS